MRKLKKDICIVLVLGYFEDTKIEFKHMYLLQDIFVT